MIIISLIFLISAIPPAVSQAITTFDDGFLFLRTIGMESEDPEYPRDQTTGIQIITDGCEPEGTDQDILLWNATMNKLWKGINNLETSFLLRAGNEKLEYSECILTYTNSEGSVEIIIYPEELWSILQKVHTSSNTVTGQISIEANCPNLFESKLLFIDPNSEIAYLIQQLLSRGREEIQLKLSQQE